MHKLKIDVIEKNGKWLWRVYSNVKYIKPNICACIAHGTAQTKIIAEQRALSAMNEILKD